MPLALVPNQHWWLDLVADTLGASRRFHILAVELRLLPRQPVPDGRHQHPGGADGAPAGRAGAWSAIDEDRKTIQGIVVPKRGAEFTSRVLLTSAEQNDAA